MLVIPPGMHVSAIDSHLRITAPAEIGGAISRPIDHVLRTLADAHGKRSIGVVLTGAGSDGAEGLRRIKDRRGLVIVQDPSEAEHDGMPRSALDTGVVDLVLPLREIARAIIRYCGPPAGKRSTRVPPTARSASFVRCSRAARGATSACIERRS